MRILAHLLGLSKHHHPPSERSWAMSTKKKARPETPVRSIDLSVRVLHWANALVITLSEDIYSATDDRSLSVRVRHERWCPHNSHRQNLLDTNPLLYRLLEKVTREDLGVDLVHVHTNTLTIYLDGPKNAWEIARAGNEMRQALKRAQARLLMEIEAAIFSAGYQLTEKGVTEISRVVWRLSR
ncbi:hypothetical protein B7Z00_00255 [Candidatus Saccharibacteria bacterium 32-50-10]|nr:MAG: hypothetical protein B7Z00_00255 [Candidatus Saccharibacteria bacterium 32-50-10]